MSARDDLVPLLRPPDMSGQVRWRKATIVAWNPGTFQSTVDAAGATFTDLPIVGAAEAAALANGDVVMLALWQSSWWIIGKIVAP